MSALIQRVISNCFTFVEDICALRSKEEYVSMSENELETGINMLYDSDSASDAASDCSTENVRPKKGRKRSGRKAKGKVNKREKNKSKKKEKEKDEKMIRGDNTDVAVDKKNQPITPPAGSSSKVGFFSRLLQRGKKEEEEEERERAKERVCRQQMENEPIKERKRASEPMLIDGWLESESSEEKTKGKSKRKEESEHDDEEENDEDENEEEEEEQKKGNKHKKKTKKPDNGDDSSKEDTPPSKKRKVELREEDIDSLRVDEMKQYCRDFNLKTTGSKSKLAERLRNHIEQTKNEPEKSDSEKEREKATLKQDIANDKKKWDELQESLQVKVVCWKISKR
ncbi:hypothetical protein RFI_26799 [Reticulomyxa filosa]|uniref:SAP domain-containing protein n=1 Tax=Reticulomyxa filosa TaxID=46433 RepID=X6M999_RETFI|nr:hypothetical protein RFI_26799 [Reticulomyxa filosa]|eukprot:ETO10578.1 hypothetical protein RFI_26799 [Reticulomyxa filosa]